MFNNIGATFSDQLGSGQLNVWRNSFPAEQLPPAGPGFRPAGVPFSFPTIAAGRPDNIRCKGQRIDLTAARYDWLYLLACSEREERRPHAPPLCEWRVRRRALQGLRFLA